MPPSCCCSASRWGCQGWCAVAVEKEGMDLRGGCSHSTPRVLLSCTSTPSARQVLWLKLSGYWNTCATEQVKRGFFEKVLGHGSPIRPTAYHALTICKSDPWLGISGGLFFSICRTNVCSSFPWSFSLQSCNHDLASSIGPPKSQVTFPEHSNETPKTKIHERLWMSFHPLWRKEKQFYKGFYT